MGSLSRRCGPSFVWLQLFSLALLTVVAACNGHPGRESETLVRVTGAFTVDQSAPIGQRWAKLGGSAVVGDPTSDVQTTPGGAAQYQTFTNGVIVASNDFGAVYITQAIFDKWLSLQGSTTHDGTDLFAYVGVPTADFVTAAGHQDGSFERGRIIVEGSTARVVYGEIYLKYVDFQSVLGLPRSEEASSAAGGRFQLFESGEIHWKDGIGAFSVRGPILERWGALGGPGGSLGFPKSDTNNVDRVDGSHVGLSGRFENGVVFASAAAGAWEVTGDILNAYETRFGGPIGWLGFPLSGEGVASSGDHFNDFQGGVLVNHLPADGFHGVNPFGTLDVTLERLQGFGDDCVGGICGSQDIFAFLNIGTSLSGTVENSRLPSSGDFGTDSKDLNNHYPLGIANSALSVTVTVDVWDGDDTSGDDFLGRLTDSYSIDNLWGVAKDHNHRSGDGAATFTVRSSHPYDHSDFRGETWWSFENFTTDELSYDQFATTFVDVSPDEAVWRHPFNKLYYTLAYKHVAKNGNCFGMGLESIYAELDRAGYGEPIHDYFPDTQDGRELTGSDPAHASLLNEINIKHGYQLGANNVFWMLGAFLAGETHDPFGNFVASGLTAALGDHPLLSIFDSELFGNGHVIRPYSWDPVPSSCARLSGIGCVHIHVADPNNPTRVPTGASYSSDDQVEINPLTNEFMFHDVNGNEWSGNFWFGGRMIFMPFALFSGPQHTPMDAILQLVEDGFLVVLGDTGKTNQISDDAGRTFFEPGLSGPPTRWDQIRRDDATRVPNLAPVVMTNALPSTMPVQMYFGRGVGATHMYDVGLAPGLAPATPVEMTLESGKMSSYFSIPGTPGQPDRVTAHSIGTANKAVSLRLPAGSQAKQVSWTVSGPQKQRWAELTQLGMNPSQTLKIRLENAGYNLVYDNDGPATQAHLRVKAGPGANPVDVGVISIPGGHTTFQFQLPVTTLALGNVVNGLAGWLVADPTVTLTAVDYSGTGIAAIEYGRDGAHWTTYAGTFTYTDEGDTFLFYRARDNAQDQELAKSQELKVDTRSPDVSVFTDQASYTRTQGFVVHFSASDPAPGSGLSVVNATLDAQVVTAGQAVDLLFFALGSHTLQVTATDVAGWSTTRTTTFTIIATIDSLPDLIRELRRRGEIDSDGIMQSFLANALAAQSAAARGNRTPAINQLNALLNDVAAQSGKHITTRAANLLSGDVRYVIATLP